MLEAGTLPLIDINSSHSRGYTPGKQAREDKCHDLSLQMVGSWRFLLHELLGHRRKAPDGSSHGAHGEEVRHLGPVAQ
jgi:hypothetical protein